MPIFLPIIYLSPYIPESIYTYFKILDTKSFYNTIILDRILTPSRQFFLLSHSIMLGSSYPTRENEPIKEERIEATTRFVVQQMIRVSEK